MYNASMRKGVVLLLVLCVFSVVGCEKKSTPVPVSIHLADLYKPQLVEGHAVPESIQRTEWTFGAAGSTLWEAGPGTADVKIVDGKLTGRSTTDFPIIRFYRTEGYQDPDNVYAIVVKMRASAGSNVSLSYDGSEKVDLAQEIKDGQSFPWRRTAPLLPGKDFRTYQLGGSRTALNPSARNILLRPTDVAGATFEIESVRLILRKEHLAEIPSGPSWQGLSEIYQETVVSRSPEKIKLTVRLPKRPFLDLSVGTVEHEPVTFKLSVTPRNGSSRSLLEHTTTTPFRWERTPIDLADFAAREVTLELSVDSTKKGAIGFWGSPVIRARGVLPQRADNESSGDPPQGVILIWADTLRADHLDLYGYKRETSPNIKQLAAGGAFFEKNVTQATWTKVSTPSMFTSLYPSSHTVKEFTDRLPSSATTIAEVFRSAGYATLSFSSILFTGQFSNMHQGFDEVHEEGSLPDQESSKTAREYVDRLLPWLEIHRNVPFFVFLHVSDPHDPYKPYPPYDTMWMNPADVAVHEKQTKDIKDFITDPLLKRFGMPTRDELLKAGFDPAKYEQGEIDWYDGSIRGMDAEVGRLLERLRSLHLDKKTLVVFTGDHGEEFLDHGRTFHGQGVYGELTHTPLIFSYPGVIPAGKVLDETVEDIDIMPTILQIARLSVPSVAEGESLLPLIAPKFDTSSAEAAGWNPRAAITEKAKIFDVGGPAPRETEARAITLDGWKLIHNTVAAAGQPEFELYNIRIDPAEQRNVAPQNQEIVQKLTAALNTWQKKANAARLKPDAQTTQTMSQEELERLRSLGYIQ